MKRILSITIMLLMLTACGSDNNSSSGGGNAPNNQNSSADNANTDESQNKANLIVAAGDSITVGLNANIAYPSVVQGQTGIEVINFSTSGIPAEQIASNAVSAINRYKPKYVISIMGTNNALGLGGGVQGAISAAQYLARVCEQTGTILVLGTLPVIPRSSGENANSATISNAIRGIRYARIADVRSVVPASEIPDGVHPNDTAQRRIGEVFAAQIY